MMYARAYRRGNLRIIFRRGSKYDIEGFTDAELDDYFAKALTLEEEIQQEEM